LPEYEAKRYEGHIKAGGVLFSVHCDTSDQIARAKDLLKHTGAQDISSTGEASADYPAASKTVAHQVGRPAPCANTILWWPFGGKADSTPTQ
jgi:hypothetical protein